MVFTVPTSTNASTPNSTILRIAATITATTPPTAGADTVLHVELFQGTAGFNGFTAIPGTDLPFPITGATTIASLESLPLNITVTAMTRLVLVAYLTSTTGATFTGFVNAGVMMSIGDTA